MTPKMSSSSKAILGLQEWLSLTILKKPSNVASAFLNDFILFSFQSLFFIWENTLRICYDENNCLLGSSKHSKLLIAPVIS